MEKRRQSPVLRAHLFKMTMLTQRAVDHSIKAYELRDPQFCSLIRASDRQWCGVQRAIGNRGRRLLAAGLAVDTDSLIARCTVRIYSALRTTYTAASEIAHNSLMLAESGQADRSDPIERMGRLVNGRVRQCTVALFKGDPQHAEAILRDDEGRQWFEGTLYRTEEDLLHRTGAQSRLELAIARSLGQVAEQAYEIAEAFTLCMHGRDALAILRNLAA